MSVFFLLVCGIPIVCLEEAVAILQSTVGGIKIFLGLKFTICGIHRHVLSFYSPS